MNTEPFFFSIIIPAHNEEKYIEETLRHVTMLDYPKDRYETIVVENASTDRTREKMQPFESEGLSVISVPQKGVSRAKNIGINRLSIKSDWTIFLDADTLIKPGFLHELDAYLKNRKKCYTVGTVSLRPTPHSKTARAWFAVHNFGHKMSQTSFAIKIIRSDILSYARYDEELTMGEDIEIINAAKKAGKFFFLYTKNVYTSTRRFEQVGWFTLFFEWTFVALLPVRLKKAFEYKIIR